MLSGSVSAAAAIDVVDDSGRHVALVRPAERIVALAPHLVEMAYAVGAGSQLVGVIDGSDFPPVATQLDRVGSYRGISLEAIIAKRPDLVLVWGSGTPTEVIQRLTALKIPVYRSEPRHLAQIADDLRDIGRLSGHESAGQEAAQAFRQALVDSRQSLTPPPRVFYQLGQSPLTTLAGGQIVTQIIRRCGGEPLFADAPVLVPQIGWESLVESQPQVILAAGDDDDWKGFWRSHDELPAVRDGALYTLDPDAISRPGPRMIEGVREVCHALMDAAK
ncbi:cobalamin-binding protein [Salinicola rhizosphaerae]|uniref:Cobalamin-binding protein n=1 Tax=Salinicola rhizosphaerae TaxID=1443141 RepID=A0ABQ3E5F2_9GAMM|nr:cobalamin-binding protein [Salinicola rhizosphaerae]GHB27105.1 cobalamin-binding protein [Salinicola rhizosphaerae]